MRRPSTETGPLYAYFSTKRQAEQNFVMGWQGTKG